MVAKKNGVILILSHLVMDSFSFLGSSRTRNSFLVSGATVERFFPYMVTDGAGTVIASSLPFVLSIRKNWPNTK